jgi:hypothetical protein
MHCTLKIYYHYFLFQTSSDNTIVLTNLSPYSKYGIRVGISNYYKKTGFPVGDAVFASTLIGGSS